MIKTIIVLPDGTELSSGVTGVNAIQSITVTEKVNEALELTLGSVCTNILKAKIITPYGGLSIQSGDELTVYREDETGTRKKMGVFTTEKPTRPSANIMSITAYDRVSWLDKDLTRWFADLPNWPYSLFALASMVCDACGLTMVNEDLPNGDFQVQQFTAEGITGRQLIRWIGQVAGRFCRATVDGEIEFAWYTATNHQITPTGAIPYYQNSLAYEDYIVKPVEKVQIRLTDNDIGAIYPNEEGELNTYIITGNYLLTTSTSENLLPIAQTLYETLKDVEYTPCKVSVFQGESIHAGDIIHITDKNGKAITTYVMTKTQTGTKVSLESTGSQRRDSTSAIHSQKYEALSGKVLEIQQTVEQFSVTASDLNTEISDLRETVKEQQSSIVETSTEIILSALESYVETSDYEEFKNTVSTQLSVMSDEILVNFSTTTEQITNVDGDLQKKFTELYKYISLKGGSITFSDSVSTKTLSLNNGVIEFVNNGNVLGSWDGDNFYTGNLVIRVSERAQFGTFAYIPRSDGSLMFLLVKKVGG